MYLLWIIEVSPVLRLVTEDRMVLSGSWAQLLHCHSASTVTRPVFDAVSHSRFSALGCEMLNSGPGVFSSADSVWCSYYRLPSCNLVADSTNRTWSAASALALWLRRLIVFTPAWRRISKDRGLMSCASGCPSHFHTTLGISFLSSRLPEWRLIGHPPTIMTVVAGGRLLVFEGMLVC